MDNIVKIYNLKFLGGGNCSPSHLTPLDTLLISRYNNDFKNAILKYLFLLVSMVNGVLIFLFYFFSNIFYFVTSHMGMVVTNENPDIMFLMYFFSQ